MELEGLAPTVFTGMILADFGAEVTIITRESGMSDVGPPMHLNYMNRGKKSLILNLKDSNHVNAHRCIQTYGFGENRSWLLRFNKNKPFSNYVPGFWLWINWTVKIEGKYLIKINRQVMI